MMRIIALVDLDDTLFQTRRKCPADIADDRLTPLGFARDGSPLSYATPRQSSFLHWLSDTTELIPVTARSRDALRRAHVPHRTAICAHGGMILEDGVADREWARRMANGAAEVAGPLRDVGSALERRAVGRDISVRLLEEDGTPLYLLAKHEQADAQRLHALMRQVCADLPPGWTLHLNDNNAAVLPPHLGKQHAVAHVLPRLRKRNPDAAVIGIGDSRTDAPFMALCDFAMLPVRSQLAERLFDAA